jgi:hypothetical protein
LPTVFSAGSSNSENGDQFLGEVHQFKHQTSLLRLDRREVLPGANHDFGDGDLATISDHGNKRSNTAISDVSKRLPR